MGNKFRILLIVSFVVLIVGSCNIFLDPTRGESFLPEKVLNVFQIANDVMEPKSDTAFEALGVDKAIDGIQNVDTVTRVTSPFAGFVTNPILLLGLVGFAVVVWLIWTLATKGVEGTASSVGDMAVRAVKPSNLPTLAIVIGLMTMVGMYQRLGAATLINSLGPILAIGFAAAMMYSARGKFNEWLKQLVDVVVALVVTSLTFVGGIALILDFAGLNAVAFISLMGRVPLAGGFLSMVAEFGVSLAGPLSGTQLTLLFTIGIIMAGVWKRAADFGD